MIRKQCLQCHKYFPAETERKKYCPDCSIIRRRVSQNNYYKKSHVNIKVVKND